MIAATASVGRCSWQRRGTERVMGIESTAATALITQKKSPGETGAFLFKTLTRAARDLSRKRER